MLFKNAAPIVLKSDDAQGEVSAIVSDLTAPA